MMHIRDFTAFVDRKKTEYINYLKQKKVLRDEVQKYVEMDDAERKAYQAELQTYVNSYLPERWKEILTRKLVYRKPCLVNAFEQDIMFQQQVYVSAAFTKPGIHQYIVADLRHAQNKLINVHEFSAETR